MTYARRWLQAPYLNIDGLLSIYSSRYSGDFRRSIWIRRPDTGWWVFFLEDGFTYLALKGRWAWLP